MAIHKVDFPTHPRPTTDVGLLRPALVGIVLTVLTFGLISLFHDTFLRDLFIGRTTVFWDRAAFQGVITFLFYVSIVTTVLKMGRVRTEFTYMDEGIIPDELDCRNIDQAMAVYQRVTAHPKFTSSLALTRVARILAEWINTEDFERTSNGARQESELDAFASDSSFRANRLVIWALPVVGFIGTVYGVSLAVSGFASFLQGAVTPEAIKTEVGNITTGLGVAFYTTLLGLICATIAAFPNLAAERKEESLLEAIDSYVEDGLVMRMPSAATREMPFEEMVTAIREGMEGIQAHMKFPVDELAQAIDAGFRRLPNPDRYEEVFTRAITKAGDLINEKYEQFQTNYERRVGELGAVLGGKLEVVGNAFNAGTQRLAAQLNDQSQRLGQTLTDMEGRAAERMDAIVEEMRRLAQQMPEEFRKAQERYLELQAKNEQKLAERFDELTEQIATVGKEQAEAFSEAHERYVDAVQELDKKEIARWEKMVADFHGLAGKLAEQFRMAVSSLEGATARYAERVQGSIDALSEQLERITNIGNEIDKVLRTTQSMEATLRQVGSSDEFRQTLANLRSHLVTSDELLKQLSRPRKVVFQEARMDEGI